MRWQNVCGVNRSHGRNSSFGLDTLFNVVPWFGLSPRRVGGLIVTKSAIFISEQGTLKLMCPFQGKAYLSAVRKESSAGSEKFGGVFSF